MEREEHRGRGRFFVGDQLDRLIRMYQGGRTANDCAEHFGVSITTVTRALRRNGVDIVSATEQLRRSSRIDDDRLLQMVDEGWRVADMARAFGVDDPAIRVRLTSRGWLDRVASPRGRSRQSGKLTDEQMLALVALVSRDEPFNHTQLAKQWNVHQTAISYHTRRIREHGWSCPLVWGYCPVCGGWMCARNTRELVHLDCKRYGRYHGPNTEEHRRRLKSAAIERDRAALPPHRKLTDAQMFDLVATAFSRSESTAVVAERLGLSPNAVAQQWKLIRKRGWSCVLHWVDCEICGQPCAARASHQRTHPHCRRERDRRLAEQSRNRRRARGLTSTPYVAAWRARNPEANTATRTERFDALYQADTDRQRRTELRNHNHKTPWTAEEDRVLIDWDGSVPLEQIAIQLGRTLYAVRGRRRVLRQRGLIED